jgi:hypothetical protein
MKASGESSKAKRRFHVSADGAGVAGVVVLGAAVAVGVVVAFGLGGGAGLEVVHPITNVPIRMVTKKNEISFFMLKSSF